MRSESKTLTTKIHWNDEVENKLRQNIRYRYLMYGPGSPERPNPNPLMEKETISEYIKMLINKDFAEVEFEVKKRKDSC